jgi:hypothetical protein
MSCVVVCRVGSGLCEQPIAHSEESCRVCVCGLKTTQMRRLRPDFNCCATEKINI